jgi:hypothetical protein
LSALNVYSQRSYTTSGYTQGVYDRNGYYQVPIPYANPRSAYAPPYAYVYPQARPWAYSHRPLTTFDTGVITWPGKR